MYCYIAISFIIENVGMSNLSLKKPVVAQTYSTRNDFHEVALGVED